ncbi:GNAT family N-acetyltransferase [Streptomyces sp. NPDC056580]|uniref:GNAT family N-acetyltransferase n=1 Tax=Streptomyces sp. NPDC056580 TaxID=3345872 RepID=UPI0036ABB025
MADDEVQEVAMRFTDVELGFGDLRLRTLVSTDAALLVEATSGEPGRSLWGAHPVGPYSLRDAQVALAAWDPATAGQFSLGILRGRRLLGAVGLIPERPGSTELAYWVRPEARGRGIASRAVIAVTLWIHDELAAPRVWLEIEPGNEPSLRLAQRVGYRFEQRLSRHCRQWTHQDAERDSWHDCLIWVHTNDRKHNPLSGALQQDVTAEREGSPVSEPGLRDQ